MAYNQLDKGSTGSFAEMMNGFGVVTVMNAEIHKIAENEDFSLLTAKAIRTKYKGNSSTLLAEIDTLKIANITVEGPNKTVTGGRYSNPLIKFELSFPVILSIVPVNK